MLFDRYVEQRNAEGGGEACAPTSGRVAASGSDVHIASWCSFDASKSHGSLSAVLMRKRKVLSVSFEADRVSESEFHERAVAIISSMALK